MVQLIKDDRLTDYVVNIFCTLGKLTGSDGKLSQFKNIYQPAL